MSILDLLTWDLDFFLLRSGNTPDIKRMREERMILACVYLSTFVISLFWLAQVTKYVPEPYLDEVFHIPQAQAYCRGEFGVWDPKLTTPPGLYFFSTALIRLIRGGSCTVQRLRATNCFALLLLLPAAHGCRKAITRRHVQRAYQVRDIDKPSINWDAVHTAVNICLFPPIFFFSGLYYTDVLSTFTVIKAYEYFFLGRSPLRGALIYGILRYLLGATALLTRQTNIFWVAVFMGGLETVGCFQRVLFSPPRKRKESCEDDTSIADQDTWRGSFFQLVGDRFDSFVTTTYQGGIHDPRLEWAGASDFFWCATSLVAATIFNAKRVASRLWPYVALLISFAGFVLWNGGVVLGDKSNHVATIHLPQMLYIWPFMAFFSFPLLISSIPHLLFSFFWLSKWWSVKFPGVGRRPQISTFLWLWVGTIMAVGVIHFNTIIHPFTLADNRHYVFYVFRYTIRRHPAVKYLLAPVYTTSAFFVFRTMAGYCLQRLDVAIGRGRVTFEPGQTALSDSRSTSAFPKTSFTLIWLISTILSLITAPLVEPRYFIIPWVIWRLNVPALPLAPDVDLLSKDGDEKREKIENISQSSWAASLKYWAYEGHDPRLWLETIWFLLISFVTGWIFLFKGFEWPQEPGQVQRFLW